jgi:rod shape-determining protein MreC
VNKIFKNPVFGVIALAFTLVAVVFLYRTMAGELVYPAEKAVSVFSRRIWPRVRGVFRASAAEAENVQLKRCVASLSVLRNDLERLEDENRRLRNALDYVAKTNGEWVAAEIISSGGGAAAAHFTVRADKGSLNGVEKGAVVVVPEGLVGIVSEVTAHTCVITLITDSQLKVACEVEGSNLMRGIITGGDEILTMRYFTGLQDVPARAKVLTSGLGGIFPRGLEVGTLLGVNPDESGIVITGEVQPLVDFDTLKDVFIRRER